ncbi:hypothetical protein RCL_jg15971.t2 [Rhizophagus clarus]|uniref:Uncharacterized protein n=1 Tax=Rhizophagus clarus TaxID=94130 RepID=A0A8H3LCN7_9GLOM|nr:hypothetical protein RCL_jg15971.t2 [Rhizophagus clarus]
MSASTNEHYLMAFLNMNAESGQHPLDVCAGQSIGYEQHLMPLYSIGYEQHLIAPNAEPWIGYEQYPMTLLNMNTEPWIEYEQYPMTLLNMNTEPWIEYEQYPMTLLNMNTEPWIGYEPSIGIGPYSIISHDMYVEPLIDTNEFLQHSISHISLAPNKHTKPSIDIRNGQHVLKDAYTRY